ncbi:hypothetical protein PDIG_14960 [Penicillium digitatum PHI26]|uniref:Uncharacterized protein n=2 Tax=Penicillium digitatum TaxID=36651 RepID=K9G8S8_PEND2|nr:hypothetical protein PDIP_30480 [Penicillium digitatum Pd1]EKV17372.1 hypothetical protein PDIG_14960 [Penicillium digitatum PHI26]EKV17635.1 hypothetical protein PDIP_30480 [Penicillium digitatum Pd1]
MSLGPLDMAQSQSDTYLPSSHFFDGQATEPRPRYKDPPNTPNPLVIQSITPDADQLERLLIKLISIHPFGPSFSLRSTPKNTSDDQVPWTKE